jgi:hypothetical protein
MTYEEFKAVWAKKTTKQVEKELASWRMRGTARA